MSKLRGAELTPEGLLARVHADVDDEITFMPEGDSAAGALVGPLSSVGQEVIPQV